MPLFPKPVTGQELFFAVSYMKQSSSSIKIEINLDCFGQVKIIFQFLHGSKNKVEIIVEIHFEPGPNFKPILNL